jgi:hypothetical protein
MDPRGRGGEPTWVAGSASAGSAAGGADATDATAGSKRAAPDGHNGGAPAKVAKPKIAGKCAHNREKRLCRECGGWALCEHDRRKSYCKDCGGAAICQHNRQRSKCKDCGAPQKICEHGRLRTSSCKKCREASMCQHRLKRARCKDCKPFRDLGSTGMAAELHDFLSVLEAEHMPGTQHPRGAEIVAKMQRLRQFAFAHSNPKPAQAPDPVAQYSGRQAQSMTLPPPMLVCEPIDAMQQRLSQPFCSPVLPASRAGSTVRADGPRLPWAAGVVPLDQSCPPSLHPYFPPPWPQFLPQVRHERYRSRREGKCLYHPHAIPTVSCVVVVRGPLQ